MILAGTLQQVRLIPAVPQMAFHTIKENHTQERSLGTSEKPPITVLGHVSTSRRRASDNISEDWGDGGIDDQDLFTVGNHDRGFLDIDDVDVVPFDHPRTHGQNRAGPRDSNIATSTFDNEPEQLENGKWACNHPCKDKRACKHQCCKEGLDKKPKPKKTKGPSIESGKGKQRWSLEKNQTKLQTSTQKDRSLSRKGLRVEHVDMSRELGKGRVVSTLIQHHGQPVLSHGDEISHPNMSSLHAYETHQATMPQMPEECIDDFFNNDDWDNLPSPSEFAKARKPKEHADMRPAGQLRDDEYAYMDEDPEMLDAALIGAEDSYSLEIERKNDEVFHDKSHNEASISGTPCGLREEDSLKSGLFVSETSYVEGLSGNGSKINWSPERKRNNGDELRLNNTKRRKEETYGVAADVVCHEASSTTGAEQVQEPDMLEQSAVEPTSRVTGQQSPRTAELRAWLTAQFGDSIELVESMD